MCSSFLIGLTLAIGQVGPNAAPEVAPSAVGVVQMRADAAPEVLPVPPVVTPAPATAETPAAPADKAPAAAEEKKDDCKEKEEKKKKEGHFLKRMIGYYCDEIFPKKEEKKDDCEKKDEEKKDEEKKDCDNGEAKTDDPKRPGAFPEPFSSPPFPMHEFQGYPLPGVPREDDRYPFTQALYDDPNWGDALKASNIKFYGWITGEGNFSTANHQVGLNHPENLNSPDSYWLIGNRPNLDQLVFRLEREPDLAQEDHISWGFRSTVFYGLDYRYTYAGGWGSDQYQEHNLLYGWDPLENYVDCYIPWVGKGLDIRVGRWVACPDIETQLAPDNYLGSHSILFTYDTYTQTGIMLTQRLSKNWIVQGGINCGDDMAPWYKGATPCGYAAVRWVANSNKDAIYTVLNQIDDARFRNFYEYGQPMGHDNYNYEVTTWEHVFTPNVHTKTEAYYMWEHDAVLGGTPSVGPEAFGAGGGFSDIRPYTDMTHFPYTTRAYGVLNYTAFAVNKKDMIVIRNEVWKDASGFRAGFPGTYTDNTIGYTHNFNKLMQFRPEIGYYRDWNQQAFDGGFARGVWIAGADFTIRF